MDSAKKNRLIQGVIFKFLKIYVFYHLARCNYWDQVFVIEHSPTQSSLDLEILVKRLEVAGFLKIAGSSMEVYLKEVGDDREEEE